MSGNDVSGDQNENRLQQEKRSSERKIKFAVFRTKEKNDQMAKQLFQEWLFCSLFTDFVSLCWQEEDTLSLMICSILFLWAGAQLSL